MTKRDPTLLARECGPLFFSSYLVCAKREKRGKERRGENEKKKGREKKLCRGRRSPTHKQNKTNYDDKELLRKSSSDARIPFLEFSSPCRPQIFFFLGLFCSFRRADRSDRLSWTSPRRRRLHQHGGDRRQRRHRAAAPARQCQRRY